MPLNFSRPTALGRTVEAPTRDIDVNGLLGLSDTSYGDYQLHGDSGLYRDPVANKFMEQYTPNTVYHPSVYDRWHPLNANSGIYDTNTYEPINQQSNSGNMYPSMYARPNTGPYGSQSPDMREITENTIQRNGGYFRPIDQKVAGFSDGGSISQAYLNGLLGPMSGMAGKPPSLLSAPTGMGVTTGPALNFSAPKA